jgi:hypothetical protein
MTGSRLNSVQVAYDWHIKRSPMTVRRHLQGGLAVSACVSLASALDILGEKDFPQQGQGLPTWTRGDAEDNLPKLEQPRETSWPFEGIRRGMFSPQKKRGKSYHVNKT